MFLEQSAAKDEMALSASALAHIDRLIAESPPLTDSQTEYIRSILFTAKPMQAPKIAA